MKIKLIEYTNTISTQKVLNFELKKKKVKKYVMLRSPHVHKKFKETYLETLFLNYLDLKKYSFLKKQKKLFDVSTCNAPSSFKIEKKTSYYFL